MSKIGHESRFLSFGDSVCDILIENEKKFIKRCRNSVYHTLLVGWLQNEIVGYLAFRATLWQRIQHMGEFALSVSKNNWGLGVGSRLMTSLLCWARKSPAVETIKFRVDADNNRAINVYQKLGFEEEKSIIWNPFDHIIMRLTLS